MSESSLDGEDGAGGGAVAPVFPDGGDADAVWVVFAPCVVVVSVSAMVPLGRSRCQVGGCSSPGWRSPSTSARRRLARGPARPEGFRPRAGGRTNKKPGQGCSPDRARVVRSPATTSRLTYFNRAPFYKVLA